MSPDNVGVGMRSESTHTRVTTTTGQVMGGVRPCGHAAPRPAECETHWKGPALKGDFISKVLNRSGLYSEYSSMRRLMSFMTKELA